MFNYEIDIRDLIKKLIHATKKRMLWLIDYNEALLSPLVQINASFVELVEKHRYELSFNGQVIYLQHLLNDLFDNGLRRIYIEDAANIEYVYLYKKSEPRPKRYIYEKNEVLPTILHLRRKEEYSSQVDFIVKVPIGLSFDEGLMKYYLNTYKIASKRYRIEFY